jgi:hypothetical protein
MEKPSGNSTNKKGSPSQMLTDITQPNIHEELPFDFMVPA